MKKAISIFIIVLFLFSTLNLIGCGDAKVINGIQYETYGLFNKDEIRKSNIEYKLILGNAIWGIILVETIIAPIYFYGFSLYEPVKALPSK